MLDVYITYKWKMISLDATCDQGPLAERHFYSSMILYVLSYLIYYYDILQQSNTSAPHGETTPENASGYSL